MVCSAVCTPGCACPAGQVSLTARTIIIDSFFLQVLDESSNGCIFPEDCPCPECDSLPSNCSRIFTPSNGRCNCPVCAGLNCYG